MELKKLQEKVILIGVQEDGKPDIQASLSELSELLKTAGAEEAGRIVQNRESIHPGTYIGKGKIEETKTLINMSEANAVVCDDELSPAQMKNLEDALDIKVLDRTIVILDIFASHARTSEGKIQVELAQLRYSMTRLQGFGASMSRLGGGIGTRGPGESKLETDRRRIRTRISQLKRELSEVVQHREVTRQKRQKNHMVVAAIVGYTNAGKSTLLNALTNASVLSEDKLFATLDPTTRSCVLPSGQIILLTDTVGFINKLPHHLIDAFRSTLEEARYADLIIHVVDSSNPDRDLQMEVVYRTLSDLDVKDKPVITLYNKCDRPDPWPIHRDPKADKVLSVSALTKEGLPEFMDALETMLRENRQYLETVIPFASAGKLNRIREAGQLLSESYEEDGIHVKAYVPKDFYF